MPPDLPPARDLPRAADLPPAPDLPPARDLPRPPPDLPPALERALRLVRVDFAPAHRQPAATRVLAATAFALAGSLAADAALVAIATRMWPATRHYPHFQFSDYGKLTVIGVLIACAAWPVVTRISSAPRWLFFRQAVAVTLVLWLPDLYILYRGQPPRAVAVLMIMHLAIALATYNALVRIAPTLPARHTPRHQARGPRRYAGRRA